MKTVYRQMCNWLVLGLLSCGGNVQQGTDTGGKTNWLSDCSLDADCSDLESAVCAAEVCTRLCTTSSACSALGADVECRAVGGTDPYSAEQACLPACEDDCEAATDDTSSQTQEQEGGAETTGPVTQEREGGTEVPTEPPSGPCDASLCDAGGPDTPTPEDSCYSPTQNLDLAYTSGATGCSCTPGTAGVCISGVALICEAEGWLAVEDGPCEPMVQPQECSSPTQNVEAAYDCDVPLCACDPATDTTEVVCQAGSDGRQYAFRCQEGTWNALDNSLCATDTTRCFSPDENVELALSGNLPGCACSEDDFDCGVSGALRVGMQCGVDGRWDAMTGRDCDGLWGDLCANGPDVLEEGGTTPELCDGSDDVRFFTTQGGGFVDSYYNFYGTYGYHFIVIDGQCNFWAATGAGGPVRTGVLDSERARELQSLLSYGQLDRFAEYTPEVCDDGAATVLRDPFGETTCYCDCNAADAPEGWSTAFATAAELTAELFSQGTEVVGPISFLITEPSTAPPPAALAWPLTRDPFALIYDDNLGEASRDAGSLVEDPAESAALRAARQLWEGSPGILMTHPQPDAGAGREFTVYLRDELPAHVAAAFAP